MWVNSLGFVLLLQSVLLANGAFEGCDNSYFIDSSRDVVFNSPNYPNKYNTGIMCRTTVQCNEAYSVHLVCDVNIYKNPSGTCGSEIFVISTDADRTLRGGYSSCGVGHLEYDSEYSKISFAIISQSSPGSGYGGDFTCRASVRARACDCGWSQRGRIIGGTQASPTEFPYMAGIITQNGTVFCGGTIISSKVVATANHCVDSIPSRDPNNIAILVGYTYLSSNPSSNTGYTSTYSVSRIIEYPSYNPSNPNLLNDIALLETRNIIEWSRGVAPICLPMDTTSNFEYYPAKIIGWGTTYFGGPRSNALLKANVTILPNSQCKANYPNIQPSQVCTYANGKDACQFDSGGGVMTDSNMRTYLIGIISYGKQCGGNTPGMNTRITSFLSYIQQNTVGILCFKPF